MQCSDPIRLHLAAWVDGEAEEATHGAITAHLASCPACAATVAGLRAYRRRAERLAAAPPPLPAGFWEGVTARLDRVDRTRASPRPLWPGVRPRPALAALALLLIGTLVWAAVTALLPGPNVSFAELSTAPPVAAAPGTEMLATPDPDRAAVWLSRRLGREIPPVNLSLVGAVCVGAVADQSARRGSFYYRTAEGSSLALHVLLARNPQLPALPTLHVEGAPFRVLEGSSGGPSGAVWQAEGHTYAALGRIPLSQLLVYVREMDRHCRERR